MTLPELIAPPARVQKIELGRSFRVKRRRDRRIFIARYEDLGRDVVTLRPPRSRHVRVMARMKLVEDFDQVERCVACGRHHKLTDMPIERCVR